MTRLNWLLRQLNDAPANLRVDAYAHMARTSTSELLGTARTKLASLVPDPKVDLRRFRISATSQLGTKRGVGRGAFIDSVLGAVDGFYESVLQGLRPWVAKAPQLSRSGSAIAEAGIDTTVLPDEQERLDAHIEIEADDIPSGTVAMDSSADVEVSDDLVSWDSAEEEIEQERSEGFSADIRPASLDSGASVPSAQLSVSGPSAFPDGHPAPALMYQI